MNLTAQICPATAKTLSWWLGAGLHGRLGSALVERVKMN